MKYALLILLASTAHADVNDEVTMGSFTRALRSDSANALTDKSLGGVAFGYARQLPIATVPKLELWATGGMAFAFTDGVMFRTLATDVGVMQFTTGARARYPLWRRVVVANARLDAGTQRVRVGIEDMAGHTARDHGWGALSTAALGLELMPLTFEKFHIGFRAELGYVATTGIDMEAKSEGAPEDTIELDRMAATLGDLDIGGRYFSFVLTALF